MSTKLKIILIVIAGLLLVISMIFFTVISFRTNDQESTGKPKSYGPMSVAEFLEDYDVINQTFRTYDPGDIVIIRDKIIYIGPKHERRGIYPFKLESENKTRHDVYLFVSCIYTQNGKLIQHIFGTYSNLTHIHQNDTVEFRVKIESYDDGKERFQMYFEAREIVRVV